MLPKHPERETKQSNATEEEMENTETFNVILHKTVLGQFLASYRSFVGRSKLRTSLECRDFPSAFLIVIDGI